MNDSLQMLSQLGLSLLSLLEAMFLFLLVPLKINEVNSKNSETSFKTYFFQHMGSLTVEGIRMTAYVILWGLLLIIPGLFKQIRWYFMPFIIACDKNYQEGKIDVLKRSNELVKGITPLIAVIILFDFFAQYFIDSMGQSFQGPLQYFGLFASGLLTLGVSIYTYTLLYQIYKVRVSEVPLTEE
ncbi:MAG: hypothetical protein KDD40_11080, partial [Bdellovibrionales bacterium]|nr:hypothetical protein [Bdellovibrionales bacterium]